VAGHGLTLQGNPAIVDFTGELIAPPFETGEDRPGWKLEIVETDDPPTPTPRAGSVPVLDLDPTRWHLMEHSADVIDVVIVEPDAVPLRLISRPRERSATLLIPRGDEKASRWPSRIAKLYVGSQLMRNGWLATHASSFCTDAGAVVCTANAGNGKSTLAYLATTRYGASFMSDDMTMLSLPATGAPTALGWPKRIAIPEALLVGRDLAGTTELRRERLASSRLAQRPGRGPRVALDPDEHRRLFGITYASARPLLGVAVVETSPGLDSVEVTTVDREEWPRVLPIMAATFSQRKYMTDITGLFPSTGARGRDIALTDVLERVPVLKVRMGIDAAAHADRLWEQLGKWLGF